MTTRLIRSIFAGALLCLMVAAPSYGCKIQVVFPEHLNAAYSKSYYVVSVRERNDDRFSISVDQAFGGPHIPGTTIAMRFRPDEQAHAICKNVPEVGKTYLIRATYQDSGIEISRFDWENIPQSDKKFGGYVADLLAPPSGQQQVPADALRRR
jgi:hypothetical protein